MLFNVKVVAYGTVLKEYLTESESRQELEEVLSIMDFGDCYIEIDYVDKLSLIGLVEKIAKDSTYIFEKCDEIGPDSNITLTPTPEQAPTPTKNIINSKGDILKFQFLFTFLNYHSGINGPNLKNCISTVRHSMSHDEAAIFIKANRAGGKILISVWPPSVHDDNYTDEELKKVREFNEKSKEYLTPQEADGN